MNKALSLHRLRLLVKEKTVFGISLVGISLDTTVEGNFALTPKLSIKIKSLTNRLAQGEKALSPKELEDLGDGLFTVLFNGPILEKFQELYSQAAENENAQLRLELVFSEEVGLLSNYPWEFLRVPDKYRIASLEPFLAVSGKVALVRSIPSTASQNTLVPIHPAEKLRVGVAISDPKIWGDLTELGEIDAKPTLDLLSELAEVTNRYFPIEFFPQNPASKNKIRELLDQYRTHILHYIGHGNFIKNGGAQGKGAWIGVAMGQARKRQIQEIARQFGLTVVGIVRIRIELLRLGNLEPR